jgi:phosphoribosylanthranilate isomerase
MLKLKVCGVTQPADAEVVAREGADYIGLIFAKSPRRVDVAAAKEILAALPRGPQAVGVFKDQPLGEVKETLRATGIGIAQLHGAEPPRFAAALGVPVIKTFDTYTPGSLEALQKYDAFAFLLDVPKGGGRAAIDPEWAILARQEGRVMISGRLTVDNVGDLVRRVRPWGADVCGFTEKSPGVKDPSRVRDFIQAARAASKVGAR